jgi:hypothetical protein
MPGSVSRPSSHPKLNREVNREVKREGCTKCGGYVCGKCVGCLLERTYEVYEKRYGDLNETGPPKSQTNRRVGKQFCVIQVTFASFIRNKFLKTLGTKTL